MINFKLKNPAVGFGLSLAVLTVVFFPLFTGNFVYLDEAYQLWHNHDGSDFTYFFVQGRWLSGKLFSQVFSHLSVITDLKLARIISFLSWAAFLGEFFRLGRKWQTAIGFDGILLLAGGIYIACSPSLAVYIGWASCFVCGTASILGLWSGHLFFYILTNKRKPSLITISLAVLLGIASLFIYQIAFSCFFLPFVFYFIKNRAGSFRLLKFFAAGYVIISVLYYLLFIFTLKYSSVQPSTRTALSFDVFGRLSFFLGVPLARAFSFNFLYNMHSVVSQAFPIVMMVLWVVSTWQRDGGNPGRALTTIAIFLVLGLFTYVPVLVAKEDFSSYRTMFALNLTAVLILFDMITGYSGKLKEYMPAVTGLAVVCFVIVATFNFHINYIAPLGEEFGVIHNYFDRKYDTGVHTVYFLRPPENLFHKKYGINQYNDELGLPSTYRDWTPEPLVKQIILERTGSRAIAENIQVTQFADSTLFENQRAKALPNSMYIDVGTLYLKGY